MVTLLTTRTTLATLALLGLAAAAATGDLVLTSGFTGATLHMEGSRQGAAAAGIRAAIDNRSAGGDGDGLVSHGEMVHFVVTYRFVFEATVEAAVMGGNLTVDGKAPTHVEVSNVTLAGAEGTVTSDRPVTTILDATLAFAAGGGTRHTLASRADQEAGAAQMTVHAPPGYLIESATGLPRDASYDEAHTAVTYRTGGTDDRTLVFTPIPTETTKAAPGGLLAAAACAIALAMRRVQAQK
ncbi:MAG: hypothetical protein ABR562_06175 [Thermoplasmatota archaeon]